MRDPFTELSQEHRVIERVLLALEGAAATDVPLSFYERAVEFLATYADGYHHGKEEERLFTYLEERGMARDYGPLGVMFEEHDSGRKHLAEMRAQIAAGDVVALRREAAPYAALMRDHIQKEDDVLFPMGRAMLTPPEIDEIQAGFDELPRPEPSVEALEQIAADLLAQVGMVE